MQEQKFNKQLVLFFMLVALLLFVTDLSDMIYEYEKVMMMIVGCLLEHGQGAMQGLLSVNFIHDIFAWAHKHN